MSTFAKSTVDSLPFPTHFVRRKAKAGAAGETRTLTGFTLLAPKASVSTNFTTAANKTINYLSHLANKNKLFINFGLSCVMQKFLCYILLELYFSKHMQKIIIDPKNQNRSLGNYLKKELKIPTALIHKLLRKKKIKLNDLNPDLNWKLQTGFEIKIFANLNSENTSKIHTVPDLFYKKHLKIAFEDENILAINKQPNIAVQPAKNIPFHLTLIAVAEKYAYTNNFKARIAHRLDKNTSGIILFAKNEKTYEALYNQFFKKTIHKKYLALVKGILQKAQTIDTPIKDNFDKIISAETDIKPLKIYKNQNCTLLECSPHTGRFHQIRQHVKSINHPIIMDDIYGDFDLNKKFQKQYKLKRHFLHAESIEFKIGDKNYFIKCELPEDLESVLKILT